MDNTVARNKDINLHPELNVRSMGEKSFCIADLRVRALLLPAGVTGPGSGYCLISELSFRRQARSDLLRHDR